MNFILLNYSARGFNGLFANKLLVLIDGRSLYTSLFAGVYWDVQDLLLEDVERVEVIRGPGATVWGSNAVNGVINIITKKAANSQGIYVTAGGGDDERGFGAIRYGGKINDNAYYRVYAKYFNRDDSKLSPDERANDDWEQVRGGFRIDWDMNKNNLLTLQGDIYNGTDRQNVTLGENPLLTFKDSIEVGGGNMLGRWKSKISDTSIITTQLYYDRTEREDAVVDQVHNIVDMEFNHQFALGVRNEIVWGLGYRFIGDEINDNSKTITIKPDIRSDNIFSLFAQNEITIVPDKFKFTIGSKFEQNDYTGFEIQPSARFLWTPNEKHTFWASISRAVRSPSRADNDFLVKINIPSRSPSITQIVFGNRDIESENLIANEIGYRVQVSDNIFLDVAAFYNKYDDIVVAEPTSSIFTPGTASANNFF